MIRLTRVGGVRSDVWTLAGLLMLSAVYFGCYEYALKDGADTDNLESPDTVDTDTPTETGSVDTSTPTDTDTPTDTGSADTDTPKDTEDTNTATDTDAGCPAGYQGVDCAEVCPSTRLAVEACHNPGVDCNTMIDGDHTTATSRECFLGQEACFPVDFDFSLSDRFYVNRVRFMSDWHNKRPRNWDLLASDDGVHYARVISASSNASPWRCVQGAPCTEAVPKECCPGGVEQDVSAVGAYYPKWDDFRFTGAVARHWRFRVHSLDGLGYLELYELEFFGNRCLGSLCSQTSCDGGICTGERPATCSCADCQPTASCESAFIDTGPGCVPADF